MTEPVPTRIAESPGVDARLFHEQIVPAYQPHVLRNLVAEWPAVQAARRSPADAVRYLAALDNGSPVDAILLPPQAKGRIGYDDAMDGFNFARRRIALSAVLEQLSRYALFDEAPAVAVQSAVIADCLPGFVTANPLRLLDAGVVPRIWLGNRITVPAHFDESSNLACVVAGRRRFTLFPPEQVRNLYIGPLDFAPTGAAMSMVRLDAPDYERQPRFREALAHARVAELGPGDAIFIPTLWWHHVESLDRELNVLVNYWWNGTLGAVDRTPSGMDSLLHGLLNIRPLPPALRAAWSAMLEHYVFGDDDGRFDHIPAHRRGLLGASSPKAEARIRRLLLARLGR
jgi:hypothetical protein